VAASRTSRLAIFSGHGGGNALTGWQRRTRHLLNITMHERATARAISCALARREPFYPYCRASINISLLFVNGSAYY